jgi:hypothetical protein
MSQPVVIANAATVELSPSPVPESWVIEGRPQAKATAGGIFDGITPLSASTATIPSEAAVEDIASAGGGVDSRL